MLTNALMNGRPKLGCVCAQMRIAECLLFMGKNKVRRGNDRVDKFRGNRIKII